MLKSSLQIPHSGRSRTVLVIIILVGLSGVVWGQEPASQQIRLRGGAFDPLIRESWPNSMIPVAGQSRQWLIHYGYPARPTLRQDVRNLAEALIATVPDSADWVLMNPRIIPQVLSMPGVRAVTPFAPGWKIDPDLVGAIFGLPGDQRVNLSILLAERGHAAHQAFGALVSANGGRVLTSSRETWLTSIQIPASFVPDLLRSDQVQWVDAHRTGETDMDIARPFLGMSQLTTATGLDGAGVAGEILDGGTEASHPEWNSRALVHGVVPSGAHGTGTTGIAFASGVDPQATGMLPGGTPILGYYLNLAGGSRYAHTAELVDPILPYRAVFQSNSWGSFPTTTNYTSQTQDLDTIAFDHDLLICQSQSNSGTTLSRAEAWAKNVVSVGGLYHMDTLTDADDTWAGGASIGPASDGRIKPDFACFFDLVYTANLVGLGGYTASFGGTSAATPLVAGVGGAFYACWHDGLFNGNLTQATVFDSRPHATLARAALIATATQWGFTGLGHDRGRFHQGWGRPDLQTLLAQRNQMLLINETDLLLQGQTTTYSLTVPSGATVLRVCLVYADPPATPAALVALVNDLDLEVTAPNGDVYKGNFGLDASMESVASPTAPADSLNPIECVFVPASAVVPGTWTVQVTASSIAQDSHTETPALDADYALCVVGVDPGPPPFALRFRTTGSLDVELALSGLPSNATSGYCLFSNATGAPPGTGAILGLHLDNLLLTCATSPLVPGNPLHWTWPVVGIFPAQTVMLPPGTIPFPAGSTTDGLGVALDSTGAIVGTTQLIRVTW